MREYFRFCSFKYKLLTLGFGSLLAVAAGAFGGFFARVILEEEGPAEAFIWLFGGMTVMFFGLFLMELLADMDIFECFIGKKASAFDFIGGSSQWKPVIRAIVFGNIKRRFLTALLAGVSFGIAGKGIAFLADGQFMLVTLAIFTFGSLELILDREITLGMVRPLVLAFFVTLADFVTAYAVLLGRLLLTVSVILVLAVFGIGCSLFENRSIIKKGHSYYVD